MSQKTAILGAGIAGLSAAASLAAKGFHVTVFEKNSSVGGRARTFCAKGFTFDMGPSWYWMPEVMEQFFDRFGQNVSEHYDLVRLDPSYRVFFGKGEKLDVPANYTALRELVESIEEGGAKNLDQFLSEAKVKYETGMGRFVWKPSLSPMEYMKLDLLKSAVKLDLLTPVSKHVRKFFKDPRIIQILEFPVLFLGAKPSATPALYTMMNYADMKLGTWYPMGGFSKLPEGMAAVAKKYGVDIRLNSPIEGFEISNGKITGVKVNGRTENFDLVIGSGDYHHIESQLLEEEHRSYTEKYWDKRVMSPSSLIYYIGVKRRVGGLLHHNLFFDEPFEAHANSIYHEPSWPDKPRFYVCCPSKTDPTVAPTDMENIFILVPVAPGLNSHEEMRNEFLDKILDRIKQETGEDFREDIVYQRSYAHEEFESDYHSFKGNAYGLANTLMQTAWMKPKMISKKLKNLIYAGQLTVPGPGVPPSIISGQLAADLASHYLQNQKSKVTSTL
jgi:phytoene desaturase